jgi:hypothetical protein
MTLPAGAIGQIIHILSVYMKVKTVAPEEQYVYRETNHTGSYAPEERYVVPDHAIKIINLTKGCSLNIEPETTYCS